MIVQLSYQILKFILIDELDIGWEWNEISIEFFYGKIFGEIYPWL